MCSLTDRENYEISKIINLNLDVCSNWTVRNGVCYKKFEETKNWTEAAVQCEGESAYLAEIPNISVNKIITTVIGVDECWIGLSTNSSAYSWRVGNYPLADPSTSIPLSANDTNKCGTIGEGKDEIWDLKDCSIKLNCAVCMRGKKLKYNNSDDSIQFIKKSKSSQVLTKTMNKTQIFGMENIEQNGFKCDVFI